MTLLPDDLPAGTPHDSYGLVMPFVSVTSQGGPHEDNAYTAGWEMGALDTELSLLRPTVLGRTIRRANTAQADLIAMKNGYRSRIEPYDDEWCFLHLTASRELP